MQQVSYGPLIMSIMLIMSCYTGFFNVRRGWQSLNTGPRFYLCLIRRTGWLWIFTSRTTDGRPFKPKKLSVPFLYPGVPAGLSSWKEKNVTLYFSYALLIFHTKNYTYQMWLSLKTKKSFQIWSFFRKLKNISKRVRSTKMSSCNLT